MQHTDNQKIECILVEVKLENAKFWLKCCTLCSPQQPPERDIPDFLILTIIGRWS